MLYLDAGGALYREGGTLYLDGAGALYFDGALRGGDSCSCSGGDVLGPDTPGTPGGTGAGYGTGSLMTLGGVRHRLHQDMGARRSS